jgi:hypothetical protein
MIEFIAIQHRKAVIASLTCVGICILAAAIGLRPESEMGLILGAITLFLIWLSFVSLLATQVVRKRSRGWHG